MVKFTGWTLDRAGFEAIKPELTASLAEKIEQKLASMGDEIKGISWFSSEALEYAAGQQLKVA